MAGRTLITSARVLELLRDGWELAAGTYIRGGAMVWMQRKIGHGGESFSVHVGSFYALRDKGLIEQVPGQSIYTSKTFYRLAQKPPTAPDGSDDPAPPARR
jgi:hypothetical protein